MTELEKMQRAKMYLDKLANGVDPITDTALPDDTILNNIRLVRCFNYVSDILRQVIENGGEVKKSNHLRRTPFYITENDLTKIPVSKEALSITRFCENISDAICHGDMKKLSRTPIVDWLLEKQFLAEEEIDGVKRKLAGKHASEIGIFEETRIGYKGEYQIVLYSEDAQRYIIGNLLNILRLDR